MKNLTKEQSSRKAQIAQAMTEVESDLQNAINQFNEQMTAMFAPIEELQGRYNELIAEAQGFLETIHEQQEAYSEERSDSWHNGDSGQAYREWMGEWNLDLDEIEVITPNPIEDPALDTADLLRDLPDHP
jgi:chromosome segregation ATPase